MRYFDFLTGERRTIVTSNMQLWLPRYILYLQEPLMAFMGRCNCFLTKCCRHFRLSLTFFLCSLLVVPDLSELGQLFVNHVCEMTWFAMSHLSTLPVVSLLSVQHETWRSTWSSANTSCWNDEKGNQQWQVLLFLSARNISPRLWVLCWCKQQVFCHLVLNSSVLG